jgi:steroid delta-isomerase-like uncharacterized protein
MTDNKDIVRRWYEDVWAKGDPGPLDELLADDYVDHNPMPGFGADKASAADVLKAIMGNATDAKMDVGHMIAEGDFVAAHWRMEWTQHGNFMDMVPADGKRLSIEGHDFVRVSDGRIAEAWHVEDVMSVMGELGVMGPPQAG